MKKEQLIWMAGFVDGEGCISINRKKNGKGRMYHHLSFLVCNKEKYPLHLFQFAFGGQIYKQYKMGKVHQRSWYMWKVENRTAYNAIKALYPYLVIKKPQAEIAFTFQEAKRPRGRRALSEEELAVREAQYITMRQLKGFSLL